MAGRYPIECYGLKFTKGEHFKDYIDELCDKPKISRHELLVVEYTYDNGYLNHPDYKHLRRKPLGV